MRGHDATFRGRPGDGRGTAQEERVFQEAETEDSAEEETVLVVDQNGEIRCLYTDDLDIYSLGYCEIRRASSVEWEDGEWVVRLERDETTKDGRHLKAGTYIASDKSRRAAIRKEIEWLQTHLL